MSNIRMRSLIESLVNAALDILHHDRDEDGMETIYNRKILAARFDKILAYRFDTHIGLDEACAPNWTAVGRATNLAEAQDLIQKIFEPDDTLVGKNDPQKNA